MTADEFYDRNDSIAAFYNISQRLVSNGPGEKALTHTTPYYTAPADLT